MTIRRCTGIVYGIPGEGGLKTELGPGKTGNLASKC